MPWERGGGGASLEVIHMLHSSGRITRQEAASMIPVELMAPFEDDLVLDLCAAPGSKATQIASATDGRSLVIANEPSNGRLNLLTTNRSRLGVEDMLIVQHDARHFRGSPEMGPAPSSSMHLVRERRPRERTGRSGRSGHLRTDAGCIGSGRHLGAGRSTPRAGREDGLFHLFHRPCRE